MTSVDTASQPHGQCRFGPWSAFARTVQSERAVLDEAIRSAIRLFLAGYAPRA